MVVVHMSGGSAVVPKLCVIGDVGLEPLGNQVAHSIDVSVFHVKWFNNSFDIVVAPSYVAILCG